LPHLPIIAVLPLLSAAAPAALTGDDPDDLSRDAEAAQKFDDQTFALLKSLQLTGASKSLADDFPDLLFSGIATLGKILSLFEPFADNPCFSPVRFLRGFLSRRPLASR
jgi:hypothetical protein